MKKIITKLSASKYLQAKKTHKEYCRVWMNIIKLENGNSIRCEYRAKRLSMEGSTFVAYKCATESWNIFLYVRKQNEHIEEKLSSLFYTVVVVVDNKPLIFVSTSNGQLGAQINQLGTRTYWSVCVCVNLMAKWWWMWSHTRKIIIKMKNSWLVHRINLCVSGGVNFKIRIFILQLFALTQKSIKMSIF